MLRMTLPALTNRGLQQDCHRDPGSAAPVRADVLQHVAHGPGQQGHVC